MLKNKLKSLIVIYSFYCSRTALIAQQDFFSETSISFKQESIKLNSLKENNFDSSHSTSAKGTSFTSRLVKTLFLGVALLTNPANSYQESLQNEPVAKHVYISDYSSFSEPSSAPT